MSLSDEQVASRAHDWADLHKKQTTRDQMDDVLDGLSTADQRRVYLCGQRIAAGLPLKVIPATTTTKEKTNGQAKPERRPRPAKSGALGNKNKVSVGTAGESKKGDSRRSRPVRPK